MESGRFLPIEVGEGGSHLGKDCSSFYVTAFPKWAAIRNAFLFRWRRGE